MKQGSRVLLVLLLALLFAACAKELQNTPKPLYLTHEPIADSLKEYSTFTFKRGDAKGSALIQGYMERYLAEMLENKGYRLVSETENPDFFISVNWQSKPNQYQLALPGLFRPANSHSPFSYWYPGNLDIETYYVHSIKLKLWKWGWDDPIWTYHAQTSSIVQDYRLSAPALLKGFTLYLPTIASKVRKAELIDEEKVLPYIRYAVANRDWALPGLDSYVTWTDRYDVRYDARGLRDELTNPRLLPLYVNLLETAVHYRKVDDTVELAGQFDVDGQDYYVAIEAKKQGDRYHITSARSLSSSVYGTKLNEIMSASREREEEFDTFRNAKLPFGLEVQDWQGEVSPFNPPVKAPTEEEEGGGPVSDADTGE